MTAPEKASFNPFNKPKFAAMERLVCSFLIESLDASPLEAIMLQCRAGLLLSPGEIEKLNLDMKAITSVYTVAQRLHVTKGGAGHNNETFTVNLHGLDFDYDIRDWLRSARLRHWEYGTRDLEELTPEETIVAIAGNLTNSGYMSLCSDFLQMATPFAQSLGGILTSMINPETYTDMLQTYKGVRNA